MIMMNKVSDDDGYFVMKVILWWNLSRDESNLVMKVMIVKELMTGDVSPVAMFRRNVHVKTGICMILPENRYHRVPVWVRGGGSNGYLGNAQMNCYIFSVGLPLSNCLEGFTAGKKPFGEEVEEIESGHFSNLKSQQTVWIADQIGRLKRNLYLPRIWGN